MNMGSDRKLSGSRALVTGASGFIGSALCRRLVQGGVEVHAVSRRTHANADGIRWHQCRLEDAEAVRSIFAHVKPDYVFHLASHVAGSRAIELVLPTFHDNLVTTVNLLIAATETGCRRILLTGSMEEPDPGPDWPTPSSPYAAAKLAAGAYGRMFHALYNSPVVVLRVFMVYGPGQQDVKKLVPYVVLGLLKGEVPKLSSGTREVDWIYVDDVVEGFVAAAAAPTVEGSTLELGTGRSVTVRAVAEELVNIIRPAVSPVFGAVPERPMEQIRVANVEDSYRGLGWRARMTLSDGLLRTVEWYREQLQHGAL